MRALYAAATGMAAQELNVQVISNNIANLRTTGYKRQQPHFQDLLYQNLRRAGSSTSEQNTQLPAGLAVGSGVKTSSTARVMSQGTLVTSDGYKVVGEGGPISINPQETGLAIGPDGTVSTNLGSRGRIKLVTFANPQRLTNEGGNLYASPEPARPAGIDGRLESEALERSNVRPVIEMTRLMDVNRTYTMVSSIISRLDDLRGTAIRRLADVA